MEIPANSNWTMIAQRAVQGLGLQPGQQVLVREHSGRYEVLLEMALAFDRAGVTPFIDLIPPDYLHRLISSAPLEFLQRWDHHRVRLLGQVDGVLEIAGDDLKKHGLEGEACTAWRGAANRLTELEEARGLPYLLVAVPTQARAETAKMTLQEMETALLSALAASPEVLKQETQRAFGLLKGGRTLTLRTGPGCELHLTLGERPWHSDDGVIDAADRERGAIVSNLPAGSVYTTVIESETHGSLFIPAAFEGKDLLLQFDAGRVHTVEGQTAAAFSRMLDSHTGDPRRISHIGIGLNPYLHQPCNWTIVDEHIHGRVFLALGENRYMGGENQSSINIDFSLPDATLILDKGLECERTVVDAGVVV